MHSPVFLLESLEFVCKDMLLVSDLHVIELLVREDLHKEKILQNLLYPWSRLLVKSHHLRKDLTELFIFNTFEQFSHGLFVLITHTHIVLLQQ